MNEITERRDEGVAAGGAGGIPPAPVRGVHRLFNDARVREGLQRVRVPLAVSAAVGLLFFIRPEWLWVGLGVSAAGELLQLWCFGALHKKRSLAVNGPYKVVRNPMYLARYLLVLGVVLFLGSWVAAGLFTAVYYLYMANRVRREEEQLVMVFGEEYKRYCGEVRRFVPFAGVSREGRFWFFRWNWFVENHGPRNALAQFGYYVVCWWMGS